MSKYKPYKFPYSKKGYTLNEPIPGYTQYEFPYTPDGYKGTPIKPITPQHEQHYRTGHVVKFFDKMKNIWKSFKK